jgi:F420-dependent methylenetetrahydromethanopterin dehydrogenase
MADTGERRQIAGRANAREAEMVRASKKMVSEERSVERAKDAVFGNTKKNSRGPAKRSKLGGSDPKASKART